MTDMNVNGLGNIQNANLSSTEKAEQKPEEIMLFGASTSESLETQGKIRRTAIKSYKGNIAGQDFNLRRRNNIIERGYQIIGNIGDKKVDVEERNKIISMTNEKSFSGKIGNEKFKMKSNEKVLSVSAKKTYQGTYKGKSFKVEYAKENAVLDDGDRVMTGTYGDQKVDVKFDKKIFGFSDNIDENKLPKDFADVAALIMVVNNDQAERSKNPNDSNIK